MREELRLAVVQYGNAPHRKTHTELQADGYQQYQKLCAPSHRTNVLAPLRAAGVMVHSFLHSWVGSNDHKLALLLRTEADPGAVLLLEPELPMETLCSIMKSNMSLPLSHCGLIGALMSMERGLRLALHGSSRMHLRRTQDYDWLLLRRLDLVQYRKFDLAGLSPSLFYLSNDCDVTWVGFVKGNGTFEIGSAGMFTSAPLKNINLSLPRMSCLRTVPHRQSHPATAGERLRVQGRAHPQVSTAADKTPVSNSFGGDWFDRDLFGRCRTSTFSHRRKTWSACFAACLHTPAHRGLRSQHRTTSKPRTSVAALRLRRHDQETSRCTNFWRGALPRWASRTG
jgi:hypothetical protein